LFRKRRSADRLDSAKDAIRVPLMQVKARWYGRQSGSPRFGGRVRRRRSLHVLVLSDLNCGRIRAFKPGGTWGDGRRYGLPCRMHQVEAEMSGSQWQNPYSGVYARMTSGTSSPMDDACWIRHGRFWASRQKGDLTREAAYCRSFGPNLPDSSEKRPTTERVGRWIGNAVR